MRRLGWVLALLLGWTGSAALAAPVPQDLVHPQRLTAGDSNQYVGTRSDREDALYFVSDVHVSSEVFVQSPVTSAPRRVLDLNADISNPAIDPAGRKLAYISYRSDSAGDVCIVDLETLENQCETGLEGSELHVQWDPDGRVCGFCGRPECMEPCVS